MEHSRPRLFLGRGDGRRRPSAPTSRHPVIMIESTHQSIAWAQNTGEVLYNGIRLPSDWPPHTQNPKSLEPMAVPCLDERPAVIPIDVGRQLFVDDFLVESTTLTGRFHTPEKFDGAALATSRDGIHWERPEL